ncbi:DNA mismatch repair protein MSH5 [Monoraphidium neglectum]|uniref:DNA mismatch repair protein MSH5 n=1 Tax=Monoraphidium neglectum TaxID=145388 RepID=A0A0D2KUD0_9CHLO|nr:DNA mismatch repair protein MSH5 [Monoraphidium neglectum]KIY99038.1 DNA mismatch repair protein MSH5 [Monoraphidium neglectum]|eukprot:XP_013898058.1 DNA mismatch repair protein MSH5 [Monoraphidium neglectum]
MGIGTCKEGFSLFGLLNRCVTKMGKSLLRQWCLSPVADLAVLSDRHDSLEALMTAPDLAGSMRATLKKVQDAPRLLARLQAQQGRPEPAAFRQLHASIGQLLALRRLAATLAPRAAAEVAAAAAAAGQGLLCDVIDLDRCTPADGQEAAVVHRGVCGQLDRLRDAYAALPDLLTQVGYVMQVTGRQLSEELLELLPDYELMWGQHDVVSADGTAAIGADGNQQQQGQRGAAGGGVGGGGGSGFTAFYKTRSCTRLSSEFGDLMYKMRDLESSICTELIRRLLAFRAALNAASGAAAELDCLLALADVARDNGYCRPVLVEEPVLEIVGGRHPLAELIAGPSGFVPNDTAMPLAGPRVHVVTGPNASGKSCYSKQGVVIGSGSAGMGEVVGCVELG